MKTHMMGLYKGNQGQLKEFPVVKMEPSEKQSK